MSEWANKRMTDWLTDWLTEWMNEWMNEWMYEWMNKWMNGWMDGLMNEWMVNNKRTTTTINKQRVNEQNKMANSD